MFDMRRLKISTGLVCLILLSTILFSPGTSFARRVKSALPSTSSAVPELVTETVDFSRTPGAKVSYFEVTPGKYSTGVYVDPLALGGGVYANRATREIQISKDNLVRVLEALPDLVFEDHGDYVTIPLSDFNRIRGALLPDFSKTADEIAQAQQAGDIVAMLPGACNVGWNDWFVSGVRNSASGNIELYYPMPESIEDKTYSCIVGFTNGEIKILDLRIERDPAKADTAGKIWLAQDAAETDIKNEIAWFTFGQKVLSEGNIVEATDIARRKIGTATVFFEQWRF